MEWEVGPLLLNTNIDIISPLFSFNLLNIEIVEEVDSIPRVGDLWLWLKLNTLEQFPKW
jgi:hypothetical protein